MKIHEWLYLVSCDLCLDRDYLYFFYIHHFQGLMKDIVEKGKFYNGGIYPITGLKSGLQAKVEWQLERQLNWMGPNILTIRYSVGKELGEHQTLDQIYHFDISTGEGL